MPITFQIDIYGEVQDIALIAPLLQRESINSQTDEVRP